MPLAFTQEDFLVFNDFDAKCKLLHPNSLSLGLCTRQCVPRKCNNNCVFQKE